MVAPLFQPSQEPPDLEFTLANARSFIPTQLNKHNFAVGQPHARDTFTLAPSAAAVVPAQSRKLECRSR